MTDNSTYTSAVRTFKIILCNKLKAFFNEDEASSFSYIHQVENVAVEGTLLFSNSGFLD